MTRLVAFCRVIARRVVLSVVHTYSKRTTQIGWENGGYPHCHAQQASCHARQIGRTSGTGHRAELMESRQQKNPLRVDSCDSIAMRLNISVEATAAELGVGGYRCHSFLRRVSQTNPISSNLLVRSSLRVPFFRFLLWMTTQFASFGYFDQLLGTLQSPWAFLYATNATNISSHLSFCRSQMNPISSNLPVRSSLRVPTFRYLLCKGTQFASFGFSDQPYGTLQSPWAFLYATNAANISSQIASSASQTNPSSSKRLMRSWLRIPSFRCFR